MTVLQTERLLLRPWEERDAGTLYRWASDPAVGPPAGWPPHKNIEESREVLRCILCRPESYAVCLRCDGVPIGSASLHFSDVSDLACGEGECELGYWLARPFWGLGIMPEAAEELLRRAFEELGMERVRCGYYEGNERSRRVQEKCGFRRQWISKDVDVPQMHEKRTGYVGVLTREDWLSRRTGEK